MGEGRNMPSPCMPGGGESYPQPGPHPERDRELPILDYTGPSTPPLPQPGWVRYMILFVVSSFSSLACFSLPIDDLLFGRPGDLGIFLFRMLGFLFALACVVGVGVFRPRYRVSFALPILCGLFGMHVGILMFGVMSWLLS
jgi:hypothetical protein